MNEFGSLLKRLRKDRKVTQRDLAERINVDFSYISKMENGKLENTPSIRIIEMIAKELETDADELILLAKKIPEAIRDTIIDDDLAAAFLRKVPKMNEAQRQEIKDIINKV